MAYFKVKPFFIFFCLLLTVSLSVLGTAQNKTASSPDYGELLNAFTPRSIGPSVMGGRTVDFAVVESNTSIIYAAIGPSGLWKSTDNGIHWFPVFENENSVAIGAVAVSQSHPDIVWVGTGEATSRNSVAIGDGVYKSTDGGKTWKHMGLTDTRHIDRVIIHPSNPDIVYIGAMGHLWGANRERGVFKTTDGGLTWKKVLYFDENTGIADMAMDPSNSKILYAAAYFHRRLPYHFTSGGPNSGLYRTNDGGETWKQLKKGLPDGVNGRIGVDICRSRPEVVYTIIENKDSGIFRSMDKGETWTRVTDAKTYQKVNFRPFYYSKLTVDPNNYQVVYAYSGRAFKSEDGGKSFKLISRGLHPDHHRIWVNPHNSQHIIDGNDGGIDISWDGGENWHTVQNGPWAEVYQVAYDMRDPYYVYIGLQDNGSWAGPSDSRQKKGILNHHWRPVGGGDGFYTQVDPRDHNYVYRNLQMGGIQRHVQSHGQEIDIMPRSSLDEEPYRFNWNSPILLSPHNPDILYFGGNFLFKSMDKGDSWVKISPDLSTNDPEKQKDSGGPITVDNTGAEIHCSIFTIAESPVTAGILWVGTDDGNLWLSRDQGKKWDNVIKNIKGLPPHSWVSRVEPSHFAEGTIYVTFDRHRSDDYAPYIYRSDNFGKTWESLRANLPKTGYLYVIREDPQNRNLLYTGSEFGLFFSFNRGKKWLPFKKGFPTASVRDIAVHPRDNDLIVGTHGRGVYIFDDIRPLQQLTPEVTVKSAHLFDIRPATLHFARKDMELYAKEIYTAPNPPFGAGINYYLKEKADKDQKVELHILDSQGKKVRTIEGTGKKGLNRVYWNLRDKPVFKKLPPVLKGEMAEWFGIPQGPYVLPGQYKVVLEYGKNKLEQPVTVKKDRNLDYPLEHWKENQKIVGQLNDLMRKGFAVIYGMKTLETKLKDVETAVNKMKKPSQALTDMIKNMQSKLEQMNKVFATPAFDRGYYRMPVKTALHGGGLPEQVFMMQVSISSYPGKPTEIMKKRVAEISAKMTPQFQVAHKIMTVDVPHLNKLLRDNNIDFVTIPKMNGTGIF